jgi:serine/threonine protein kinase
MQAGDILFFPSDYLTLTFIQDLTQTHSGATKLIVVQHESTPAVLKMVSTESMVSESQVQHMFNEKLASTTLSHPNIVQCIKTCKDQSNVCFLLNLIEGLPLHELLQANTKFSL